MIANFLLLVSLISVTCLTVPNFWYGNQLEVGFTPMAGVVGSSEPSSIPKPSYSSPMRLSDKNVTVAKKTSASNTVLAIHNATNNTIYRSINGSMYKCVQTEGDEYTNTLSVNQHNVSYDCRRTYADSSAGRLMQGRTVLLIGGPHFSGTSILYLLLGKLDSFSVLRNTKKPEDEGQHVQDVYKAAKEYGGPCEYALSSQGHFTDLDFKPGQEMIFQHWSKYWDMDKNVLVEKSPPNIMKSTWFQSLFDYSRINGYFVFLIRHPYTILQNHCLRKRRKLLENWFRMMDTLTQDIRKIKQAYVIRYEEWMTSAEHAEKVYHRLVDIITNKDEGHHRRRQLFFEGNRNDVKIKVKPVVWKNRTEEISYFAKKFESRLQKYGYSMNSTGFTSTLPESLNERLISS